MVLPDRRAILSGFAAFVASSMLARSQSVPKLIVLPKGITSPMLSAAINPPKREISLEGWLLCNGAAASRTIYQELFDAIGTRFGSDDASTFDVPKFPAEYRGDVPIKGWAMCPFSRLGVPGVYMPFSSDSNL
jgi:Phage Tail Collar Domain